MTLHLIQPHLPLTEDRIREIVREEIAWALKLVGPPSQRQVATVPAMTPAAARRLERDKAIAASYDEGLTQAQCAERHGVHPNTVANALRRLGIINDHPPRPKPKVEKRLPFRERQAARFRELAESYESGLTILGVAAKHGANAGTVSKALRALGVTVRMGPRSKTGKADARLPEMRAMFESGKPMSEIGSHFGISRERVRQIFVRAGIDTTVRHLTPKERAAADRYAAGDSLILTAESIGVSPPTMRGIVERAGHAIRPTKRRISEQTRERAEIAARLYGEGKETPEIARALGLSNGEMVYRFLAYAGVKPNRVKRKKEEGDGKNV